MLLLATLLPDLLVPENSKVEVHQLGSEMLQKHGGPAQEDLVAIYRQKSAAPGTCWPSSAILGARRLESPSWTNANSRLKPSLAGDGQVEGGWGIQKGDDSKTNSNSGSKILVLA